MGKLGTYTATDVPMITGPQLGFLTSLTNDLFNLTATISGEDVTESRDYALALLPGLTQRAASARISELKDEILPTMRQTARYSAKTVEAPASVVELDEKALYMIGDVIYRVKRSGRGNLYALTLNEGTRRFDYAPGAISKIRPEHKMTLEQCKAFGDVWSFCARCGADLTDPVSVAQGMGPVCIKYQR